ncbi:MAG: hypothetical protein HOP23_05625 [Methylococcaceae bacterium]|nr:hypothetical protein [Methylococcaceae bacterium]
MKTTLMKMREQLENNAYRFWAPKPGEILTGTIAKIDLMFVAVVCRNRQC